MVLHVAKQSGFQKILLRTMYTNVVSLIVQEAANIDIQELWVAFGTGQHFRYTPVPEDIAVLKQFTILFYDSTRIMMNIVYAQQELFTKKERSMDGIPPTRADLAQHTERSRWALLGQ